MNTEIETLKQEMNEIQKVRTIAWPNLRILKFASEILNVDIHTHVEKWKYQLFNSEEIFIPPDRQQ